MRRGDIWKFKNRCNGQTMPRAWLGTTRYGAQKYSNPGPEWFPIDIEGNDLSRVCPQTPQGYWLSWQPEWRSKVKEAR